MCQSGGNKAKGSKDIAIKIIKVDFNIYVLLWP